jgi:hypothetical protein
MSISYLFWNKIQKCPTDSRLFPENLQIVKGYMALREAKQEISTIIKYIQAFSEQVTSRACYANVSS